MKKFLFGATLVGMSLTGCVNDNDAVLTLDDNSQPITFEVAKFKASSRDATSTSEGSTTVKFPTTKTFGTFAFKESNSNYSVYMDNVEIKHYSGTGEGYWAAAVNAHEYLWPSTGHIDFISYAPYVVYVNGNLPASVPIIESDANGFHNTLKYKDFRVNEDETNNQVDLLYSDKSVNQKNNTSHYDYTGVPTLFRHALAKLNFRVAAAYLSDGNTTWNIIIHSIKLKNIFNEGSVTLKTNNNHSTLNSTTQWENQNLDNVWNATGTTTVTKTWTADQALTVPGSNVLAPIYATARDYFVIPQTMNENRQCLTVNYTISSTTVDDSTPVVHTFTKDVYFNKFTSVPAWRMGQNITYTIVIDPQGDVINFAPAIEEWSSYNGVLSI